MNLKKLSRKEKEKLYVKSMTDLQLYWGNPIDDIWDFSNLTDEDLEKSIKHDISQLKFEKIILPFGIIIKIFIIIVIAFVILGIFGLLIFGIKQLF